jgi:aminopeptidase
MDERITKLAHNLVNNSCKVQKGEHVLINTIGQDTIDLARALIKEIHQAGGYPHIELKDTSITREMYLAASETQLTEMNDYELYKMKKMDAIIGIRSTDNTYEYVDVPNENVELTDKLMDPVLRQRVDHSKWVVLRYPNGSMAQAAKMSKEAFEDYYFNVCNSIMPKWQMLWNI